MQRVLRRQIHRHQQLAAVYRVKILFSAGIVGAVFEHREPEQDVVVQSGAVAVLTYRVDRLRMHEDYISDREDILSVADRYVDDTVGNVDDLHLLMPVMRYTVDVLGQDPDINDIGEAVGTVYLCFLICSHVKTSPSLCVKI